MKNIFTLNTAKILGLAFTATLASSLPIKGMEAGEQEREPALCPQRDHQVQHINVPNKKNLDNKRLMKPAFLTDLLKRYQGHALLKEAFRNPANRIKNLYAELKATSSETTQLFLVTSPRMSFIVKGMKKRKEEIAGLVRATNIQGLSRYFYPNRNYQYPQFLFPVSYVSYTDKRNQRHYLSIMPQAPGISLASLVKQFADQPGDRRTIKLIAQSYFDTGAALARFYQDTQGSITQGDLHAGNIFYKPENRQVTFIDNECTKSMRNNAAACNDLAFLLLKSLFAVKWITPDVLKKLRLTEWYSLYMPNFIAGYLSVFPLQQRREIYQWLENCIMSYRDPENNMNWYTDKGILGFDHKKYMGPIFESLSKSQVFFTIDRDRVNVPDNDRKTPLHRAALNGEWRVIWPLISADAHVDAHDRVRNTPLHEASYNNHVEAIKALVRAGADIHAINEDGVTPLAKAKSRNNTEAMDLLKHYGARY